MARDGVVDERNELTSSIRLLGMRDGLDEIEIEMGTGIGDRGYW